MITRELRIFLIVGVTTVAIDFLTYRGLVWLGLPSIAFAKGTGFITGTVFAYFANRFWTFGHKGPAAGTVPRFAVLYAATLGANVLLNSAVLRALGDTPFGVQAAFLVATAVSAALNFLGMKFYVFNKPQMARGGS
jgi:putative flippase GtrA